MPDTDPFWKAAVLGAVVGILLTSAMLAFRKPRHRCWWNSIWILAIGLGIYSGSSVLSLHWTWPPRNALERFLTLVLPMALAIEWIAGLNFSPNWVSWLLRGGLAVAVPRILLHGSVYLGNSATAWPFWQAVIIMGGCSLLTLFTWGMLSWLSCRSPNISISLGLQMAIVCAGLTVMMAGYIKGGAAALPLVGTLMATAVTARFFAVYSDLPVDFGSSTMIGISIVGLVCLLLIGRFFGELSTGQSLVIFLSPLLSFLTEIKGLQHRQPWIAGGIRLTLVAIPLLIVLTLAKRNFDRDMSPLLTSNPLYGHVLVCSEPLPGYCQSWRCSPDPG